jgi:hypothetical protein
MLRQNIDPNKIEVLILSCPAAIPFIFARHTWIVVNNKGTLSRYEVMYRKNIGSNRKSFLNEGYLYKNLHESFQGISIFPWQSYIHWNSKVETVIDISNVPTDQLDDLLLKYPNKYTYRLLGPNSNTYTAWVLKTVFKLKNNLPWNAFGKDY